MPSRIRSFAGVLSMIFLLFIASVVSVPLLPYLAIGILGGWIIGDITHSMISFFGVVFLLIIVTIAQSPSEAGQFVFSLLVGIVNSVALLSGGAIGVLLFQRNTEEQMDSTRRPRV